MAREQHPKKALAFWNLGCSNHSVWFQYEKKTVFSPIPPLDQPQNTNLGEPRLSPAWPWPSKCSPSTGALAPKVTIKPTFPDEKISKVSKVAIQVGLIIISCSSKYLRHSSDPLWPLFFHWRCYRSAHLPSPLKSTRKAVPLLVFLDFWKSFLDSKTKLKTELSQKKNTWKKTDKKKNENLSNLSRNC